MSKSAHVVDGEASESESEIETGRSPELHMSVDTEPFVVAGEAPESDDESKLSSLKTLEESEPRSPAPQRNILKTNYNSLLHQKLWECNISLRATVEGLLRHTTDISVEKLSRADKTLLSAQESMRATNSNLTLARARLKQIHTSLDNTNCGNALPTLRIKQ